MYLFTSLLYQLVLIWQILSSFVASTVDFESSGSIYSRFELSFQRPLLKLSKFEINEIRFDITLHFTTMRTP